MRIIFLLLIILKTILNENIYHTNDDNAYGTRISANDQFIVYAINRYQNFIISYAPFTPMQRCSYQFSNSNHFVYSLSTIFNNNNNNISNQFYSFIQISEDIISMNVYISIITVDKLLCNNSNSVNVNIRETLIWSGIHHQYMLLKVTPSQNYAYVFSDSFVLSFDIINNRIIQLKNLTSLWPFPVTIIPHGMDLTDKWIVVASFAILSSNTQIAVPIAFLCGLQPLICNSYVLLFDNFSQESTLAINYNRDNDMSVAVSDTRQMALIGYGLQNTVLMLTINATSTDNTQWTINKIRIDIGSQSNIGFGRSVAWINDTIVAITLLTINDQSWSQSEVWIFDVDKPFIIPLFNFPNNQQILNLTSPPLFLQIVSWSGNLFILTDLFRVLLIPSRSAGYHSIWFDNGDTFIIIFDSSPCIGGTYKQEIGFGLCTICPTNTKNPGNQPCSKCISCYSDSFCPLGSVDNISLVNYSSYTQTFSYPDSPDMNNYDDILVQNIFTIGHSAKCLIIAPLFWTLLAMALCFIVWLIMAIGKVCQWKMISRHRERAKKFLKKTDIVGEGERWIGGLFSFAIVVLFGFTFWFAADYLSLYPIETSGPAHASCDSTMRNAIFDNALQLSLPNTDGSRWPIFDMLDAQPFTITADLINTRADCSSITVQQNRPGVSYLKIPILSCITQADNATISVTFALPAHEMSIQLNITGPYFVGGIRLCFYGPGLVDGVNTLQSLNICQFLFTENETLANTATLSVVLIKVINQAKPLTIGSDTLYSGRWTPTFTGKSLSDKLIYEQFGNYLRYTSQRTTFIITLTEQSFFLQNNQKPIVRIAELAFHTLLFCTLIIELFAIAFLLFKLIFMPLIRLSLHCYHRKKSNSTNTVDQPSSLSIIYQCQSMNPHVSMKRQSSLSISSFQLRHLVRNYERKKHKQRQRRNIIDGITHHSSNQTVIDMNDE